MSAQQIPTAERLLLLLAVALFPLYLWESALPQVSHMLFLLLALMNFGLQVRPIPGGTEVRILAALVALIFVRQVLYGIAASEFALMPAIHAAFNLVVFLTIRSYALRSPDETWRVVLWGLAAGVLIETAALLSGGFRLYVSAVVTDRAIGTFNNPNQLGYYAVLVFSVAFLAHLRGTLSLAWLVASYAVCGFLVALSLSKAAMLAFLFVGSAFFRGWRFGLFLLLCASVPLFFPLLIEQVSAFRFADRLMSIGRSRDDSLVARGFGPLLDPDWRLAFGWGEGYVTDLIGVEIHSTLGNVLISYGIVGFALFAAFLLACFSSIAASHGRTAALVAIAAFNVYGIAHNGIRFTMLWVFLALTFSVARRAPSRDAAEHSPMPMRARPAGGAPA